MTKYANVNYGLGEDKFQTLYDNFNDTVTDLKSGTSGQVLTGSGISSDPLYTSFWGTPIVVGSGGGAPDFTTNFTIANDPNNLLRFKKSVISGQIQLYGRIKRQNSSLNGTTGSEDVFVLPSGYRPIVPIFGICLGSDFKPFSLVIQTTGEVILLNRTGSDMIIGQQSDILITFPFE